MFGEFRKSHAHGHEANELESFMDSLEHRELEPIQYFYHMTTTQSIRKILDEGAMMPRKTDKPFWTRLARDKNSPMGVWFSASLYHSELPSVSQYGENRLKIPCQFIVQNMVCPRLYLETFYWYSTLPKNQVVRLILVDAYEYEKENEWCKTRCLRRLNMADNKVLALDRDNRKYMSLKNDGITYPYMWVELLVVGRVEVVSIDVIDESTPSKQDAIPGKVPP